MTDTQDEGLALIEKERFLFECASNSYFRAGKTSNPQHWMEAAMLAQQHRNALTALRTPPAREREAIARIIDPDEWLFFDNANAVTKMQKPVSLWRIEPSLAKADAILALSATPASPVTATDRGAPDA